MADSLLIDGATYRFISRRTSGVLESDERTHRVVVNDFVGTKSQQWTATKASSGFWRFRNLATGYYLGIDPESRAWGGTPLTGTPFPFVWEMRPHSDQDGHLWLVVPNTEKAMAEDEHGNFPGKMQVQLADRDSHIWQKWRLDTNVAPCPPCIPREMYKIINIQTSTLAHLENNGNVSGFCYNEGRNQLWEPIPYEGSMRSYLYYFKNVFNGKYLGIRKHEEAKHETRVIGCDEPFLWNVVPDVGVTDGYRLFVPFTEKNMDLCGDSPAPGTVIHLDPRRIPGKCWKFERVYQVEDPRDVFGNELQLGPP